MRTRSAVVLASRLGAKYGAKIQKKFEICKFWGSEMTKNPHKIAEEKQRKKETNERKPPRQVR